MTGKTHAAVGLVTGLALSAGEPIETKLIFVVASTIGSLAPDLDHPKAKLNQRLLLFKNKFYSFLFYLLLAAGSVYLYISTKNVLFGLLGTMAFLISISSHRGFTHSVLGFLISTYIIKIIAIEYSLPNMYCGFSIGYLTHIIADFFTVRGIQLFYPLDKRVSSPIVLNTNNFLESIVLTAISFYSMYLLYLSIQI
ncbi:MAG TPA: metal-dependent hydrolase [Tissierellaceae bacterium]|nr:metal-dependent hydrolase [Tissierellaceae bacterium]